MTRAAAKLHLAQPALSQAIAQLESDLGLTLFERHARGVTLTPAGEAFLVKARAAVSAWSDAVTATQELARSGPSIIEFGFVGVPPGLDSPGPIASFARRHPHIEMRFRELPFPSSSPASWLAEVDVAACHAPPADPLTWSEVVRHEARVVLAQSSHPLAKHSALNVADALDETFIGFAPSVDAGWASFWSLDDHRGGHPAHVTRDRVTNAQEALAALSTRQAITTVPSSVARVIAPALTGLAVIPLRDAEPATITLSGRVDRCTPAVGAIRAFLAGNPIERPLALD